MREKNKEKDLTNKEILLFKAGEWASRLKHEGHHSKLALLYKKNITQTYHNSFMKKMYKKTIRLSNNMKQWIDAYHI